MAAAPSSPVTPVSPATPTAGDNGSLLLIVFDNTTGRSFVEDLSLTISQIQPVDMNDPGTVIDFGTFNLSLLNNGGTASITANQRYLVVAADYQSNLTYVDNSGGGFPTTYFSGGGNNLYVTGLVSNDYSTLTDPGKMEQSAKTVNDFLNNIFNNAGQCNGANPCATASSRDNRYFGLGTPPPFASPPAYNAGLGLGGLPGSPSWLPYDAVGSALNFWALTVSGNDTDPTLVSAGGDGNTNTLNKTQYAGQFLLDSSGHLTYTVAGQPSKTLTVVVPPGTGTGSVTSSPSGINCGSDCTESYSPGTQVTLTATPDAGSTFSGWSGGGCSGTATTCIVTLNASTTVTATFSGSQPIPQRTLTISLAGTGTGSVTSSPTGVDCGTDCTESYDAGTSITLTAVPSAGSNFSGWSGGGCSGTATTCTVTLNANTTVTASFNPTKVTLAVAFAGLGWGSVTSSPSGINCGASDNCTKTYDIGTVVRLTVSPTVGSTFNGWSGACSGTGTTCDVTMDSAKNVSAEFGLGSSPTKGGGALDWSYLLVLGLLVMRSFRRPLMVSLVAIGNFAFATPADNLVKQDSELVQNDTAATPTSDSSSDDHADLQQVVVTATKRAVGLEKLPAAVTAITSERLDQLNAQTFEDYFRTVPGLMMNETGSGLNRFDFSLRGISSFNTNAPPTSATVSQYYDEIPITAVGQQIDPRLVDIERIEVLRGPQGTYFGEDSLGGTIRFITKKPLFGRFDASAETRFSSTAHGGSNDAESVMVNVPLISDKLAFRGNYVNAHDSGFIDDVTGSCAAACTITGSRQKDYNGNRTSGERGMLLFQPMERLSILAEVIHSDGVTNNVANYQPKVGELETISNGNTSAIVERNNLYNLTANLDLGAVSLVSSSSWGDRLSDQQTFGSSGAGGAGLITQAGVLTNRDNFAQELRLASSPGWSNRWDYIVGAYYAYSSTNSASYDLGGNGAGGTFVLKQVNTHKAGFGELGYKFTERLSARLGLRHQTVDFVNNSRVGIGTPNARTNPENSGSNEPTTGRAVVNYDFNDRVMTYASVSKGFRQGGVNPYLNTTPGPNFGQQIPGIPQTYDPDTTTNYELGWKQTFPSIKATLNAAVYHIDWRDIQIQSVVPVPGNPVPQQFHLNAGRAKVDGLELEGGLELMRGLQLQASLSRMNPRISESAALAADSPPSFAPAYCQRGCPPLAGDLIPWVAKVSGSATLNYRHALWSSGFNGFAVLTGQYTGKRNTDFAALWTGPSQANQPAPCTNNCARTHTGDVNSAFRTMPASVVTNLQLGIENARWRAAVYADNLFDRRNINSLAPAIGDPAGDVLGVSRPRTIGFWLRAQL